MSTLRSDQPAQPDLNGRLGPERPALGPRTVLMVLAIMLGVALFSYAGRLHWGLIADWDLVPDLHDFVVAIERAFADLCEAAGLPRPAPQPEEEP